MDKITIPLGALCYYTNRNDELTFYVGIHDDIIFNEFCIENNIGYHSRARKDVIMTVCNTVFTKDKGVFKNFPTDALLQS